MSKQKNSISASAPTPPPEENTNEEEKSMTIFRNNYIPTILPPWQDRDPPNRRKSQRCSSASVLKNKDSKGISNDDYVGDENFETHVGWTGRVKYAVDELREENARRMANKDEIYRDSNRLLEITISTIMLMAMHETIPDENYVYASLYLQNITDDFGNHPPNISKILQLIQKVLKENDINWGAEITQNYSNKNNNNNNVTVLRFPNKSRIPVRSQKKSASEVQLVGE